MRVLSCKLKCLSICFSNPSHSLQSPPPLTLEDDGQQNVSNQSPVAPASDQQSTEEKTDEPEKTSELEETNEGERIDEADKTVDVNVETIPKSCLKKSAGAGSEETVKGRVKWMDLVGKELVEVREFEPIESGESDDEDTANQSCTCVIQ